MVVLILAAALGGAEAPPTEWKQAVDGEVRVWTRAKEGARVAEIKAEMLMEGSPREVRAVLTDESFTTKAPYVAEYRTVARPDPLTWIRYTRLAFPIIDDRDYFIEVHRESDLAADGTGIYHATWRPWGLEKPARDGVVRVTTNEGYWDVRAGKDPAHADVTYYLFSDPGGHLPAWTIDLGNKRILPDILRALQREVLRRRPDAVRAGR